ncbi:MAG TPA: hypothetical protein VLA68_03530 [Nitrososphaera sp.]|nr:hypothetical protein [Nitrososphaera sp.]
MTSTGRLRLAGDPASGRRRTVVAAAIAVTAIAIVDILATRQMFPYDNFSGAVIFALNITVAYGLGSFLIMRYVGQVSRDVRRRSAALDVIFKIVVVVQFVLLAILTAMFFEFYYRDNSVRYLTYSVFAISTITATAVMGIACFKFLSWYRLLRGGKESSYLILICGLATASLATAMMFDATAKLLLVRSVEEASPPDAISQELFIYRNDERFQGELQYKVVKPDTTTFYIVPSDIRMLYHYVNGWIPITVSFGFTWAITAILLNQYYQRRGGLPILYLVLIILPIVLYMIGRTPDLYTVMTGNIWHWEDFSNPYLLKSIFRAGVIGGSIMFGVAFLVVSRALATNNRIKDYLIIAAIGAALIGISLAPSAQQQTFGVAGRSLMLLASFLLSFGFYLSAVSIAQDTRLRQSIKAVTGSQIMKSIATAQLELQVEKQVLDVVSRERNDIEKQTGLQPPLEEDVKNYLDMVVQEIHRRDKVGTGTATAA